MSGNRTGFVSRRPSIAITVPMSSASARPAVVQRVVTGVAPMGGGGRGVPSRRPVSAGWRVLTRGSRGSIGCAAVVYQLIAGGHGLSIARDAETLRHRDELIAELQRSVRLLLARFRRRARHVGHRAPAYRRRELLP